MFKDGVMEVSKDNEIAYSEVAKVSPCKIYSVSDPDQIRVESGFKWVCRYLSRFDVLEVVFGGSRGGGLL